MAQTVVTATLVDINGATWANALINITFVQAPNTQGPSIWRSGTLTPVFNLAADSVGHFTIILPSNSDITPAGSYWRFSIAPNASTQGVVLLIPINGAAMDISGLFTSNSSIFIVQSMPVPRAYSASEVELPSNVGQLYYNTTLKAFQYWDGAVWQTISSGTIDLSNVAYTNRNNQFSITQDVPGGQVRAYGFSPNDLAASHVAIGTGNANGVPLIELVNATATANQRLWLIAANPTQFFITASDDFGNDHFWLLATRQGPTVVSVEIASFVQIDGSCFTNKAFATKGTEPSSLSPALTELNYDPAGTSGRGSGNLIVHGAAGANYPSLNIAAVRGTDNNVHTWIRADIDPTTSIPRLQLAEDVIVTGQLSSSAGMIRGTDVLFDAGPDLNNFVLAGTYYLGEGFTNGPDSFSGDTRNSILEVFGGPNANSTSHTSYQVQRLTLADGTLIYQRSGSSSGFTAWVLINATLTPLPPTQTDVTGLFEFNVEYQNTGPGWLHIRGYGLINGGSGDSQISFFNGPSSASLEVWSNVTTSTIPNMRVGFSGDIPPGYFYKVSVTNIISTEPGRWIQQLNY